MALRGRTFTPSRFRDNHLINNLTAALKEYLSDNLTLIFFIGFLFLMFLAIFGQRLAPYDPNRVFMQGGQMIDLQPPSLKHPLGTTSTSTDVYSRLLYGARPTLITGLLSGTVLITMGLLIGVSAGYYGGLIDNLLMRFTDFMYSLPFIPIALLFVSYFGMGTWSIVFMIGLFLWRGNARIFRSQVLQIREREHVQAAKVLGASDWYVITRHILPSMGGMIFLFYALGTGATILITASLAFLGFVRLDVPTWGLMLRNAHESGYVLEAWWWTLTPGFAITFAVLCIFMLGRGYERVHDTNVSEAGE